MRTAVDWSTSCPRAYKDFCKKHPSIKISSTEWRNIIFTFNEGFRDYLLETGEVGKLSTLGEFSITKKKRKKIVVDKQGVEHINLPVDWAATLERGKTIYNFNYHTDGFFFGWLWFKNTASVIDTRIWKFIPNRPAKRLLAKYLKSDEKYQHLYQNWREIRGVSQGTK